MNPTHCIRIGLAVIFATAVTSLAGPLDQTAPETSRQDRGEDAGRNRSSGRILIPQQSYYYILPKTATQARINRSRQFRREAFLRNQATQNLTGATSSIIAPGALGGTMVTEAESNIPNPPSDSTAVSFVPRFSPNYATPRVAPVPQVAKPKPTPTDAPLAEEEIAPRPKVLPISETRGPAYNDSDPLLGYQLEQAKKGNPESQYAIGMRYLTGNGVEQNDFLARDWLEKSSARGNLIARAKLRQLRAAKSF